MKRMLQILSVVVVISFSSISASAIVITGNFLSENTAFPGTAFLAEGEGNVAGGGNLTTLFNAAAAIWAPLIPDGPNLTVNYGWFNLGGPSASTFVPLAPQPPTEVNMALTNAAGNLWFMDLTPADATEYGALVETDADLGGGLINIGREYTAASGDALRQDMFTVLLHELGHALGLVDLGFSDPLDITAPRPNAGTSIDLTTVGGLHLQDDGIEGSADTFDDALLQPSTHLGRRRLISDADLLAVLQIRDSQACDLNGNLICDGPGNGRVPHPGTVVLVALGMLGLALRRPRNPWNKGS
jgi:hypothetical protein